MIVTSGPEQQARSSPPPPVDRDHVVESLHRRHYRELVGLARLLLDERGLAEEVVQEAFARTYEAWPRVRDQHDPLPYVRRTIVNLARSGLRRRAIVRRVAIDRVADAPGADAQLLLDEQRQAIALAVEGLPRRQRECVVLRFYGDCAVAEIATTLGISDGAVKQHLHRAAHALANAMDDVGGAVE